MTRAPTVRVVIADDELPARQRLRNALNELDTLEIVAEAQDGNEAVDYIRRFKPDLLFLDVQMPGLNGFEVLQHLERPPAVIFTTAYDEYAIRAFEVHAVDYLLKPYGKDRFRDALQHALARIRPKRSETTSVDDLIANYRRTQGYLKRISVRKGNAYKLVPVSDVDFFRARDGLIFLVSGAEEYVIDVALNHLERELDPARFFRLHRNALINLGRVVRISPDGEGRLSVSFPGGEVLPVSRRRAPEFRRVTGIDLA